MLENKIAGAMELLCSIGLIFKDISNDNMEGKGFVLWPRYTIFQDGMGETE